MRGGLNRRAEREGSERTKTDVGVTKMMMATVTKERWGGLPARFSSVYSCRDHQLATPKNLVYLGHLCLCVYMYMGMSGGETADDESTGSAFQRPNESRRVRLNSRWIGFLHVEW